MLAESLGIWPETLEMICLFFRCWFF